MRMINNLDPELFPDYKPVLAVDATGVGAPVVDLFKREKINAELRPIQIVGGANISEEFGMTRVPKRDLVSVVQVVLQNRTLKIASQLPDAATLVRELQNFTVKSLTVPTMFMERGAKERTTTLCLQSRSRYGMQINRHSGCRSEQK